MAIKLYGVCIGEQQNKYDLWIDVVQNSQSIQQNSTNLTIGLYLKRNDGSLDSAFNLNTDENTVALTVQGQVRVNENLVIDTRFGNIVQLARWTGDIPHNANGTLPLSISGSFDMAGEGLTGGDVNVVFDCTPIPRLSTLTFSKESVAHGDTVGVTIECASEAFSHEIRWSLGNRSVTHTLSQGMYNDVFTVPLVWAEEITEGRKGNLCARLTTYNGTQEIGSRLFYINYIIPDADAFLTEFSLVTECINNDVPEDFGVYVKGKSKVRVSIEDIKTKYGATVSSVVATTDYMQKHTLPAVFDLNKAGYVKINLRLTDSRGFTVEKSETIYVYDYDAPALKVNFLVRCDSEGRKTINGTHLLADLTPRISDIRDKNKGIIKYKYKKADSDTFSGEFELSNFPCVLPYGEFSENNSYIVAFKITDTITTDNDFYTAFIPDTSIPFNIKKGGNGASFGCYAQKDNELTVAWDMNVLGNIVSESIPFSVVSAFSEQYCNAKYFNCLGFGFLHLKLEALRNLSADNLVLGNMGYHHLDTITPVNVTIISDTLHTCNGYIDTTGDVIVNSDKEITTGDMVYVKGMV